MNKLMMLLMLVAVSARAQDAITAPATEVVPVVEAPVAEPVNIGEKLSLIQSGTKFIIDDLKANTKFKIDSTIPLTEYDWRRGQWSYGTAVPFLNIGSYLYTGAVITKNIEGNRIDKAGLIQGIRLNDITRPLAQGFFEKVLRLDLDKHTMLDFLAKSTSAGVTAGHDFNSPDMKKVAINSFTAFFGLEMAFGPSPEKVTAQSVKARKLYFR
jgi:hypothetical protein